MMRQVSEVSRKLGVNPQTLYFYERIGLIPSPSRTELGYRLYADKDLTLPALKIRGFFKSPESEPCVFAQAH